MAPGGGLAAARGLQPCPYHVSVRLRAIIEARCNAIQRGVLALQHPRPCCHRLRSRSMARLPWRTAITTIALALLVFLPSIAPRAGALWGRAAVVNASGTAVINHDRSTLIIGSQYGDPQNLDPIATFLLSWGMMASNIFDALVYRGPDLKINKEMGLATGWRYLDHNTLRFTLRQGVTFQDGEPFHAAAVKITFDRLLVH